MILNRLKPYFVLPYTLFLFGAFGHSIYKVINPDPPEEEHFLWVGALLTVGYPTICFVLGGVDTFKIMRGSGISRLQNNLELNVGLSIIACGLTCYYAYNKKIGWIPPLMHAIVATIGWQLYLFWFTNLGVRSTDELEMGKTLPSFVLTDYDGYLLKSDLVQKQGGYKYTLFLFCRGNWCPLCMSQIRDVEAKYNELEQRGCQILLISPQPHHDTKQLAHYFKVDFRFMTDNNNAAAKLLGILNKNGVPKGLHWQYGNDTVLPTVVLTNCEGTILYSHLTDNFRIRPIPQTFLDIIDTIEKKE